MKAYNVAVVGATGAVGKEMMHVLEERNFPVNKLIPMALPEDAGKKVLFQGKEYEVKAASPDAFEGAEIALFSAGGGASLELAPEAVKRGVVVVDNSSAFRMEPGVPLVVPEVNPQDCHKHQGIIANPNCSTIQMVAALKPLHDAAKIKRVVVSTYQAVSGSGLAAIEELHQQTKDVIAGEATQAKVYPYQIAFNALPHIDVFLDNDYTKEEMKMINETKKILGDDTIRLTATTVRIPVVRAHSEAVNIETETHLSSDEARELLAKAPGIKVVDDPANLKYPLAIDAEGQGDVLVGRIRQDFSIENGLNMWVVADNLLKGAALNAVQIAEYLIAHNLA